MLPIAHSFITEQQLAKLTNGWVGYLLATFAGSLVTLSLAPFDLWPLGIVSIAILAGLVDRKSPRQAAKTGWFYGFGLFGTGTSWVYVSIHVYGYAPIPLAAILTLLFCCGLALLSAATLYCYTRWVRDTDHGNTIGFAAVVVLGEWLRSWLLTGFPWLYLGYAHIDTPLAGWAPIGGVWVISFVVAYSGAAIAAMFMDRGKWKIYVAATLLLWVVGGLLNQVNWVTPAQREPIKIAMVQANISQHEKWSQQFYAKTLKLYHDKSSVLWQSNDIVIWPEAAIPNYYQYAQDFLNNIDQQANSEHSTLITGIPFLEKATNNQNARSFNSIMAFGDGEGVYHKQRLVPFGEYIPLENWLRGLIRFFDLPMSAFSSGGANQQLLVAGDVTLAPFICYEIVYPDLVSSWLPEADLLITISNDAWFGKSIGPLQHLQMAQMRALEAGRYLLRATGSGVSAIVDHRGRLISQSQQFKSQILSGEARVFTGSTPIAIFGTLPLIIICIAICLRRKIFPSK